MSENQQPTETASLSFMQRFIGVLTSPRPTFDDVVKAPSWFLPLLISTIVIVLATVQAIPLILEQTQEQMLLKNPDMPQAQIDMALNVTKYVAPAMVLIMIPLMAVVTAGLMMLIGGVFLGGESTFKKAFASVAWTMPVSVVVTLFTLLMRLATNSLDSMTNLTFLAPDAAKDSVTFFLLSQFDLLTFWSFAITGIAFAAAFKFETKKGIIITFITWAVIVALIAGIKAAF